MKLLFLSLLISLLTLSADARVEVAFVEAWTRTGQKVELEKGGRFAHVAIRYAGMWLHSAPRNGTELITNINVFGNPKVVIEILVHPTAADLTETEVASVLGLPYDFKFHWEDTFGTYCSKLVGKILNVLPLPMKFDGTYWSGIKNLPVGEPGISPDGLYKELKERGYSRTKSFPR